MGTSNPPGPGPTPELSSPDLPALFQICKALRDQSLALSTQSPLEAWSRMSQRWKTGSCEKSWHLGIWGFLVACAPWPWRSGCF